MVVVEPRPESQRPVCFHCGKEIPAGYVEDKRGNKYHLSTNCAPERLL